MTETAPVQWQPPDVVIVPNTVSGPNDIAAFARQLTARERSQIADAFQAGMYEIGTSFIWNRTMAGLKERLASLGMEFIAEILDRPDIRPNAEIHEVLTDFDALRLAEDLGMLNGTQALRLRHTLELIAHFAKRRDDDAETMNPEEAVGALRVCVQAVLGHEELAIAEEFASFRRRLETGLLNDRSTDALALQASAYFYKRTVVRTLLASSKTKTGAQLENVLANLNVLLPTVWDTLKDPDRYIVGRAYAELHSGGQSKAAMGLRSALLKVAGFDYVPENLRSAAFLEAADRVQAAHFGWNNFYAEPEPMSLLAALGSSIPGPAFHKCMTSIVLVRIGNPYGISNGAQGPAMDMLQQVSADRWQYFFDQCLPVDDVLLGELVNSVVASRWCELVTECPRLANVNPTNPASLELLSLARTGEAAQVAAAARTAYFAIRRYS